VWCNFPMGRPRLTAAVAVFALAASAHLPALAGESLRKCVSPSGEVKFTNQECPEGYSLEASRPASPPSSQGEQEEPYICRFSSILSSAEIVSALSEAEISLSEAGKKGDAASARYWRNCLDQIRQRQAALRSAPQPPVGESVPSVCADGTFDFREGGVYFSNNTRYPCSGLRAVCTFEVRGSQRITTNFGAVGYTTTREQRVLEFDYGERIGKFGTARIGDVTLPGRVLGWDCRLGR